MKKILLTIALVPSVAFAAPAPTYKLCAKGDTISAKPKCKAGEVALNLSSLQGKVGAQGFNGNQGPQGPQGAQGPAGVPGTINPFDCITRSSEFTASSRGSAVFVNCAADEFLMTHGMETDDVEGSVNQIRLLYNDGIGFPQGVRFHVVRNSGATSTFNVTVKAVCCKF